MKRGIVGVVGLFFLAMVAVQAVGAAIAIRRKQDLGESVTDPASDEVALSAISRRSSSGAPPRASVAGSLTCMFGGGILDLRGATLAPGGATLRVEAFDRRVPRSSCRRPGGSSSEARTSSVAPMTCGPMSTLRPMPQRCAIEGWAIFGGFGIASDDPRGNKDSAAIPDPAVG